MKKFPFWAKIVAALGLLAGPGGLFAQMEIERTERLSIEQGLADQTIRNIHFDQDGFLWLATDLDLERYDGYQLEHFNNRPGNAQQLHDQGLRQIGESNDGSLYLRYRRRQMIDVLHADRLGCTAVPLDSSSGLKGQLKATFMEKTGGFFALSCLADELVIWRLSGDYRFLKMGALPWKTDSTQTIQFLKSKAGGFWLYASGQGLWQLNGEGKILQHIDSKDFKTSTAPDDRRSSAGSPTLEPAIFYEDGAGRFWLSFRKMPGLYLFQKGENPRAGLRPWPDFMPALCFSAVWEDGRGALLFASPTPDDKYTYSRLQGLRPNGEQYDAIGLLEVENKIQDIVAQDFDRQIFLGTYSGLYQVFLKNKGIHRYLDRKGLKPGEFGAIMRDIVSDQRGHIYFALEERHWYCLDTRTDQLDTLILTDARHQPIEVTCSGNGLAYDPAGFLWGMSCTNQGERYALHRYDLARKTTRSWPLNGHLVTFYRQSDGRFWLVYHSTEFGGEIGLYDPRTEKYQPYANADGTNPFAARIPKYLFPSRSRPGILWIATNNGLVAVDYQRRVSRNYGVNETTESLNFSLPDLLAVTEDEAGLLWLGTGGGGLNILELEKQNFDSGLPRPAWVRVVDTKQGLCNNQVVGLLPDGKGGCILSTNFGLSTYHPATQIVGNFYKQDGLSHTEFNLYSFFKDERDRFYFGTINGLNTFRLEDLQGQKPPAKIHLTKLTKYYGKTGQLVEQVVGLDHLETLVMEPEVTYFQLEFMLADYAQPGKNQFYAWLEGEEKDWSYLGNTHVLRYNRLPAGEYTLHLRAADAQGNVAEAPIALRIRSEEFFYRRRWFLILVFSLLVGAVWVFSQWRIRSIRAEEKRQTALNVRLAELEIRALQAQMNPHFIFNCLNSIQSFIASGDKHNAMRYVTRFAQLTRAVLHFSGKSAIGLDEEMEALGHYLELESLRTGEPIQYRIEVAPDIDTFDTELPPMLVQPFVENSFKHGKISSLSVSFQKVDGQLVVSVQDDGVGLQTKTNKLHQSKGIALTRERLAYWNGRSEPADLRITPLERGLLVTMNIQLK